MNRKICRQETRVELNFLTTDTVTKEDLVPSKNLKGLGNLYLSLASPLSCRKVSRKADVCIQKWFMQRLKDMKILAEDPLSPVPPDTAVSDIPAFTTISPHFPALPPPVSNDEGLKLALTKNMAMCVRR
jgi:exocyst complex component 4